jgi:hypothetical protein
MLFASFPVSTRAESAKNFYYQLAGHWAPDLYQDTWFMPEGDYLVAFNADGDWIGRNNLENFLLGKFKPYAAVVYYSVIESETHYFIYYCFYHAVDYDTWYMRLIPGTTHENDMEGIMVTVAKVPDNPWGKFRAMEALAHSTFHHYANGDGIKPNQGSFEPAKLRDGAHVEIYIEGGGHGPYELHSKNSPYTKHDQFRQKHGVVYRFAGQAGSPQGRDDRNVGYDLKDFLEKGGIWDHRCGGDTFDLKKRLVYQPPPGRPGVPASVSACPDSPNAFPRNFDGDLSGFANTEDAAKPFWSWAGPPKTGETRGNWGLDPAWTMSQHYIFEEPFSLNYVNNFYLGINPK